ncbi:L,D-transpeptidase family protein [Mobilicoccus sp.]|uniref:L,D-transpeptidase family protein n=1 Tax=Mobilicoccus sp. TaxID=2034349 RepID=UPI0028A14A29|nr:L,D-transpeptidase family protein [Mobilicoccus sp.]
MSRRLIGAVLVSTVLAMPAAPAVAAGAPAAAPAVSTSAPTPRPTPTATKAPATKAPAKKTPPKKTVVKKTTTRTTAKKPSPKKPATTKTTAKKTTAKKSTAKKTTTVLRQGAKGAEVVALQKRLSSLGYWTGTPNGTYGYSTMQAVMAIQKVAGLGRDGVAGPSTRAAIDRGVRPSARTKTGRAVEIDLKRQVILFVDGGTVRMVLNTSTGTKATPTPTGSYRVTWGYSNGWRTAPLGKLYRPKYFHRGYAVHGVADGFVPGYPASHGCARVSTAAMDMLWKTTWLRNGNRVTVY